MVTRLVSDSLTALVPLTSLIVLLRGFTFHSPVHGVSITALLPFLSRPTTEVISDVQTLSPSCLKNQYPCFARFLRVCVLSLEDLLHSSSRLVADQVGSSNACLLRALQRYSNV